MSPVNNMLRPLSQGSAPTTSASSASPPSASDQFQQGSAPRGPSDGAPHPSGAAEHATDSRKTQQASDWPDEFSLESKPGYSNQLIGLSCESDPYLLRHYHYNTYGNYSMFRLDFRQVAGDDAGPRRPGEFPALNGRCDASASPAPLQFMMLDEAIFQEDVRATERILSGEGTEAADVALLNKIVNRDLGARLLKLRVSA